LSKEDADNILELASAAIHQQNKSKKSQKPMSKKFNNN